MSLAIACSTLDAGQINDRHDRPTADFRGTELSSNQKTDFRLRSSFRPKVTSCATEITFARAMHVYLTMSLESENGNNSLYHSRSGE